ncbi:MAG TPA: DUF5317 family protein, partial [Acidimicrobiales bacterium]|nr:DUF5317 family protein [Acidimicrobiales bacterium]
MALLPLALLLGAAAGRLAGGRLSHLARMRFRHLGVVALAVGVQVALGAASTRTSVPAGLRGTLVVGSDLLVGAWILLNLRHRPTADRVALSAVALGWLANLVPIVADGSMPVSAAALRRAAMTTAGVARGHLGKHVLLAAGHGGLVALLGDWIPIRPLAAVASPGDLLMAAGLAALVAAGTRPARTRRPREHRARSDAEAGAGGSLEGPVGQQPLGEHTHALARLADADTPGWPAGAEDALDHSRDGLGSGTAGFVPLHDADRPLHGGVVGIQRRGDHPAAALGELGPHVA